MSDGDGGSPVEIREYWVIPRGKWGMSYDFDFDPASWCAHWPLDRLMSGWAQLQSFDFLAGESHLAFESIC